MENLSTLEIVLGVITIISTMYGVYAFISRKAYKEGAENANLATLKKDIDNLPCKERGKDIFAMKLDLRQILTILQINPQSDRMPTIEESLAKQNSPRAITEFGEVVCEDSGANVFYATHRERLIKEMGEHNPMTKLDVETMSLRVLLSILISNSPEDIFKPLKDWVYENPSIKPPTGDKLEVSIEHLCLLISLKLRDEYISLQNIT